MQSVGRHSILRTQCSEVNPNVISKQDFCHQTVIFEEDEDGPEVPGRTLACADLRNLDWKGAVNFLLANDTTPSLSVQPEPYRRRRNRSQYTNRRSTSAATRLNITRIQTCEYHRINLVSPVIVETGSTAWKHANDLKVKLGSHCLFFNHPEYFQAAAKVLAMEYHRKCEQEAKVREDKERARSLLENVKAPTVGRRPSFCAPNKDAFKPSVWVSRENPRPLLQDMEEGKVSFSRVGVDRGSLLNVRPWNMDQLDQGGLELDDMEKNTGVRETYDKAHELLVNHFSSMDHQIRIPLVPILSPKEISE